MDMLRLVKQSGFKDYPKTTAAAHVSFDITYQFQSVIIFFSPLFEGTRDTVSLFENVLQMHSQPLERDHILPRYNHQPQRRRKTNNFLDFIHLSLIILFT